MFDSIINIGVKMSEIREDKVMHDVVSDKTLQAQMVDFNQMQLQDGEDADGRSTGTYSRASVTIYGKEPGRITLYDTGEFYDSMKVSVSGKDFKIIGNTLKPDRDLLDRWPKALGLTDESMIELMPEITELTIDKVKDEILSGNR